LINAQEGKTTALRQWRFKSIDEVDKIQITDYIREAVRNVKEGRELRPNRNKPLHIPDELKEAFKTDPELEFRFNDLSLSKKREYVEHITEAKRINTKISRLQKVIPLIKEGKGLNDKYRK
jgi:uncharacterized protein YdeI (YjbR/CyaY-like superfamily)